VAADPDRLATPYADGSPQPSRMTDPEAIAFAGDTIVYSPRRATDPAAYPSRGAGMVGTARDYLKLLETLRSGGASILRRETVEAMTHNAIGAIPVTAAGPG